MINLILLLINYYFLVKKNIARESQLIFYIVASCTNRRTPAANEP